MNSIPTLALFNDMVNTWQLLGVVVLIGLIVLWVMMRKKQ